jgi:hypothetical protein
MPRAAPGDIATGALRRKLTESERVPARDSCRRCVMHFYWLDLRKPNLRLAGRLKNWCYFTLKFSAYGVGRGCLGEVVSLVGDCRPPPPGNPHRPTISHDHFFEQCNDLRSQSKCKAMGRFLSTQFAKIGDSIVTDSKRFSLYKHQNGSNLKRLAKFQYFKKNRSFISCTGKYPVLEFCELYSHLCGIMEVKPPSIAITNVLEL